MLICHLAKEGALKRLAVPLAPEDGAQCARERSEKRTRHFKPFSSAGSVPFDLFLIAKLANFHCESCNFRYCCRLNSFFAAPDQSCSMTKRAPPTSCAYILRLLFGQITFLLQIKTTATSCILFIVQKPWVGLTVSIHEFHQISLPLAVKLILALILSTRFNDVLSSVLASVQPASSWHLQSRNLTR